MFSVCSGIIYGGDFRQLIRGMNQELLYSRDSKDFFENIFSGIIILDNKHQFKDDPKLEKLLKYPLPGRVGQLRMLPGLVD